MSSSGRENTVLERSQRNTNHTKDTKIYLRYHCITGQTDAPNNHHFDVVIVLLRLKCMMPMIEMDVILKHAICLLF